MKIISDEDREELSAAVGLLNETEREVITLRFGLDGGEEHTQKATAQKVNMALPLVAEVEGLAINKMRARMFA